MPTAVGRAFQGQCFPYESSAPRQDLLHVWAQRREHAQAALERGKVRDISRPGGARGPNLTHLTREPRHSVSNEKDPLSLHIRDSSPACINGSGQRNNICSIPARAADPEGRGTEGLSLLSTQHTFSRLDETLRCAMQNSPKLKLTCLHALAFAQNSRGRGMGALFVRDVLRRLFWRAFAQAPASTSLLSPPTWSQRTCRQLSFGASSVRTSEVEAMPPS